MYIEDLKQFNISETYPQFDDYIKKNNFTRVEELIQNCNSADYILWLFTQTNPKDSRLLTLAKGQSVNLIRQLLDNETQELLDVAISYGENKATEEELRIAYETTLELTQKYLLIYRSLAEVFINLEYEHNKTTYFDTESSTKLAVALNDKNKAYEKYSAYLSVHYALFNSNYHASYTTIYALTSIPKTQRDNLQRNMANICRTFLPIEIWNI